MTSGGNNISTTFQGLKLQFPELSRTKVIFQEFPGTGILKTKIQEFPGGVGTLQTTQIIHDCSRYTDNENVKPNTHRRRDETVESRHVGGVYTNLQLVGDSFVVSSV